MLKQKIYRKINCDQTRLDDAASASADIATLR